MGLVPDLLDYIERCGRSTIGELRGVSMLELGNQLIMPPGPKTTGKKYYRSLAVEHTSFDLNGRDGALPVDLGKPCTNPRWHHRFDIVTNSGTTEHVEPLDAQYEVFRNVHRWLRPGGVAVHLVPDVGALEDEGAWAGHCNNYYSFAFFEYLAQRSGCELILPEQILGLVCVGVHKVGDAPFGCERGELLDLISRREGGQVYSGINDASALMRFVQGVCVRARRAVKAIAGVH